MISEAWGSSEGVSPPARTISEADSTANHVHNQTRNHLDIVVESQGLHATKSFHEIAWAVVIISVGVGRRHVLSPLNVKEVWDSRVVANSAGIGV